ncbi:alpha/beta fold hydrolase [Streptomyces sp. MS1.AVA.1]|uniref:Alpha/beta fold hydrolase n=1 Tax=Streptomyces machairae TaxID=3134109 RepID=A0ABU8URM9_9ACTN
MNPGGPGGSGLPYAVTKRAKLPASVRRSYDVIGFDPRGVGHSAPAGCGAMGGLFAAPGADPVPTTPQTERSYLTSLRDLADDCATGAGKAVLPYLSTEQTADDMDAIRAALGEPRTSFLGVSYGTYLGAAYAARFPHRVGRMVLDSVVGPWDWYDFDVIQSRAMLRARDTFFAWTTAHAGRFGLGGDAGAVRRSYLRVRQGLAARPVDGFGRRSSTAPSTAPSAARNAGRGSPTGCAPTCRRGAWPACAPQPPSTARSPATTRPPTGS